MKTLVAWLMAVALLCVFRTPLVAAEIIWSSELLRDHPLAGKIYDTRARKFIPEATLMKRLAATRHVLLGEIHDNADHHNLQARVIRKLVDRGKKPAIVMEMIGAKQIDGLLSVTAPGGYKSGITTDDIADALKWADTGWPKFSIYEPIFATAVKNSLLVLPGEPFRSEPQRMDEFISQAPLSTSDESQLHTELLDSHCGVLPETAIPKIAKSQRLKDAKLSTAMKYAVQDGNKFGVDSSVLIAGSGHTRADRGVPHYLRHDDIKSHVSVSFVEVVEGETDPLEFVEPSETEYVWFTPRHDRVDPCIAMRKQFGKSNE